MVGSEREGTRSHVPMDPHVERGITCSFSPFDVPNRSHVEVRRVGRGRGREGGEGEEGSLPSTGSSRCPGRGSTRFLEDGSGSVPETKEGSFPIRSPLPFTPPPIPPVRSMEFSNPTQHTHNDAQGRQGKVV